MPFTTSKKFKSILMALSILRYVLKSSGATGTTDAYKHAEKFFANVLNLAYELDLKSMNLMKHNYPAIDLGDKGRRVCFQVTGENSSTKIEKTIKTFFEHGLDKDYDKLKFLILTTKRAYSKKFTVPGSFDFDASDDVFDVDDVLKTIESKPPAVIDAIHSFVERELSSVLQYFAPPEGLLAIAEPRRDLPPSNAQRLLKYMGAEPEEYKDIRNALLNGYKKLTSLSEELRQYLYLILERGEIIKYGGERIGISPVVLEGILNKVDSRRQSQMYQAVSNLGMADVPEGEYPTTLYLLWSTPFDVDLFVTFRKLFGVKSDELKRLLVDADFTLLDK
ncbi:MAG: SMEK domain-containing protein [Rhodoferax sp.]